MFSHVTKKVSKQSIISELLSGAYFLIMLVRYIVQRVSSSVY